jgi:hypothetical protein
VAPEIEKPAPATVTAETVTGAVPDEFRVSVCVDVAFNATLPKASVLALRASWAEVPVPLRLTVAVLPVDELLETVMVPLAAPATVGTKLT